MNEKNNEPAFPLVQSSESIGGYFLPCMALRDYFAIRALPLVAAELSNTSIKEAAEILGIPAKEYTYEKHWPLLIFRMSYRFADAGLAERSREQ